MDIEDTLGRSKLHVADVVVIAGYFAFVLAVGLWSSRKNRGSAGGYFLAGRNMHWIPVGASLFASNIGSLHFVGLAGSGAASGISIAMYELNALYITLLLGYVFLPVYTASGVFTMPEYLQKRFGGVRIQIYLAILALLVYIFTKISADLYSGALFIEQSLNWNLYASMLLLLGIAAIFTITGGLTAVIWTDFIQTIIMIVGAFVLMVMSFLRVGGYHNMVELYPQAISNYSLNLTNASCGRPREDYMHLFRDPLTADIPWPGVIGLTINSIWYWCSDQVIVQRALAGKTYDHAKAGTILCGYLKILPLFLLVFPGMIARILFTETVACADPDVCEAVCGSRTGCSNIAYPSLVLYLLPPGARGLMLAVMMAALMSSLTSIFNSSSTIFAIDVWTRIRKSASELELMIVGRIFVVVLVVISIIWVPVIKASQGSELFVYIQEVSSFLQPPICAVFVLGLFWPRLNEMGAFVALVVGMGVGLIRFAVEYSYTPPPCGSGLPDPTPSIISSVHYLYFSMLLFFITAITAVIASYLTAPIDPRCLLRLTWWTRHSKEPRLNIDEWSAGLQSKTDKVTPSDNPPEAPLTPNSDPTVDPPTEPVSDALMDGQVACEEGKAKMREKKDKEEEDKEKEGEEKKKEEEKKDEEEEEEDVSEREELVENCQKTEKREEEKDGFVEFDVERVDVGIRRTIPLPKRVLYWVCGIDEASRHGLASHRLEHSDLLSIRQCPRWRTVSDAFAVLLIGIGCFLFGFFA